MRRGISLIELLVTITIVAILAAVALGIVQQAVYSAREYRTQALVTALYQIVQPLLDYSTRVLETKEAHLTPEQRLMATRELIKYELPDRWSDLTGRPIGTLPRHAIDPTYLKNRGIGESHFSYYTERSTAENQGAELLYLVIRNGDPEAFAAIPRDRSADTDGDGHPEFIDGWGHPISWLRCPVGYPFKEIEPDPYDPYRIDWIGRRVRPLIYSPGPDRKSGIDAKADDYVEDLDPFNVPSGNFPGTVFNAEDAADNIMSD